jgi:5-methylcytosine-specific restriction endonuclease McrA
MKKYKRNLYVKRKRKKKKRKKSFNSPDQRLLRDWSIQVRTRDSYTCRNCKSKRHTHAHHMVSKYYVPEYTLLLSNGITLCKKCHLGPKGVHGKSTALTPFIEKLRNIYKEKSIKKAVQINE